MSIFIQFLNFFLQGYTVVLKIKMLGQRSMQFEVESNSMNRDVRSLSFLFRLHSVGIENLNLHVMGLVTRLQLWG